MFVFKAAVVGAGTMGGQIAQTIAAAGVPVVLKDIDEQLVQAGLQEARNVTRGQLDRLVQREKLSAEQAQAQLEEGLGRISGTISSAGFGEVDFVIDAVPERMGSKQADFAQLDPAGPGHGAARGRAPATLVWRGALLRAEGHAKARLRRQAGREDRRRWLL